MRIPPNPARLKITKRVWWSNCIISFGVKLIGVLSSKSNSCLPSYFNPPILPNSGENAALLWRYNPPLFLLFLFLSLSLSILTEAQRNVSKTSWKVLEGEQPFKRPLFLSWNKCTSHSFKFDLTARPATPVIADPPGPEETGETRSFHIPPRPYRPSSQVVTRGYLFAN